LLLARSKRDVELGATAALIWAHRQCDRPDEQEILQLQTALSILEDRASPAGFLLAATFHWHTGGKRDARRYLLKVLDEESYGEMTPIQAQIHNLYGWLHVSSFPTSKSEKEQLLECRKYFERVLSSNKQDLEALLGLAKYNEILMKYRFALDKINEAIVVHPWFVPALFEKAKLLLLMKDWDQSMETAERILSKVFRFLFLTGLSVLISDGSFGSYSLFLTVFYFLFLTGLSVLISDGSFVSYF
jgi:tetratricopeptide repeat protein 21B